MAILSPVPMSPVLRLDAPRLQPRRFIVSGQVQNASSAPLVDATVMIYETATGFERGSAVSDANGNYTLDVTGTDEAGADYIARNGVALAFFATAYSSDGTLAGVTVNTLIGTPS